MPEYDPTRDEDTKIITKPSPSGTVILPDGSKPVPMGSGVITGALGEGGMAVVYEIWNEQLGVKRAIKLLRPNSSQENKDRFNEEVKITAQLDHPNIIIIHAVGKWNDLPYIEMEMVDGVSLDELIKKQGALPLEVCTSIAIIISRALDYTHHHEYTVNNKICKGLLHRDLKPGNILISRKGIVRLADFGIATPTDVASGTSSGKVIGSMQYLAPEQLEEDEVDMRADIFSFGCIVYEMLTGERTFPDRNITKLVRKRLKNEFKPLSLFDVPIPIKLNRLIYQCLLLHVKKRPKDIKYVLDELEKIHRSITLRSSEDIIASYARGENVEEDITITQRRFPVLKFASIALIITLITISAAAFGLYFFNLNSRTKAQSSQIAEEPVTGSVTIDMDEVQLDITSHQTIVPKKEKLSRPKLMKKTAPGISRTTYIQKTKKTTIQKRSKVATEAGSGAKKLGSKIPAEEKKTQAFLEKFQDKYNTDDPVIIMKGEYAAKHYDNVLGIYSSLSGAQAALKEARLLKHRALVGTRKINKSYFDNTHINDGEFYLSKAQFLYKSKQYQRALWVLGIIKTSPTVLINKKELHKKVLYYTAKCNTAIFNSNPTSEKQKTVMQNWFNVKNEFRNNQNHPYFTEANKEIRKISKKSLD